MIVHHSVYETAFAAYIDHGFPCPCPCRMNVHGHDHVPGVCLGAQAQTCGGGEPESVRVQCVRGSTATVYRKGRGALAPIIAAAPQFTLCLCHERPYILKRLACVRSRSSRALAVPVAAAPASLVRRAARARGRSLASHILVRPSFYMSLKTPPPAPFPLSLASSSARRSLTNGGSTRGP